MTTTDRAAERRAELAENAELESMARALLALDDNRLALLPLTDEQRDAVEVYRRTSGGRGLKRQLFRLAGLLRPNRAEVQEALGRGAGPGVVAGLFEQLERARSSMISGGNAEIEAVLETWPALERQRLRQLVRAARKEQDKPPPHLQAKKLFAYLREGAGL